MSDRSLEPRHLNVVKKYYMTGGDLFLQAEKSLFKVHSYFFDRESPKFQEMLSRPTPTGQAAYGSLHNPVVLPDVTSEEFQQLLWVFYNPVYSYEEAKLEDWGCILSLACRFRFPEVKKLAVRNLEKYNMDLVERISLYQECNADEDLLIPLYAQLCARDRTLSVVETHKLGYETAVMVFQAREHLRSPADRGKSPLPDDIEEGEIEDTIRDIMKDLFSGNPNDNRKSISANGWAAAYEEALATLNTEHKPRSIRRIQRPLPPPAPPSDAPSDEMDGLHKMETITEVSTVQTGRTNSLSSEVTNSKRGAQLNGDVWPDTEEESTHVQESEPTTPKEKVHQEHINGFDNASRRLSSDERRGSMRWSRAHTFRTVSTASVPPLPGSWSES